MYLIRCKYFLSVKNDAILRNLHPSGDIDSDSDIDIFDIVIPAGNYGESW